MDTENAVLIAGGYGVVGQQVAHAVRRHYPELPLIIAGRNLAQAEVLARELTNAETAKLDTEQLSPLIGLRPGAILAAVNDPRDYLLLDAIRAGIPYVDITRWTERVRGAVSLAGHESLSAPIMLSSGWMAGVASVVAVALSRQLERVDRIDISVLYALKDKAGPNSAEYMDRLATPFEVLRKGERTLVFPYTDPCEVTFPGGYTAKAYRFDTPDQLTLPDSTGASTVAARIAFDNAVTTGLLVGLIRSGLWKLISGERFTPLRRRLLYNPGSGASHEIVIEAAGVDQNDEAKTVRATVADPEGQTHLTAMGALVQLQRLLGLDDAPPPAPGIVYPDTAPQVASALQVLRSSGVTVTLD